MGSFDFLYLCAWTTSLAGIARLGSLAVDALLTFRCTSSSLPAASGVLSALATLLFPAAAHIAYRRQTACVLLLSAGYILYRLLATLPRTTFSDHLLFLAQRAEMDRSIAPALSVAVPLLRGLAFLAITALLAYASHTAAMFTLSGLLLAVALARATVPSAAK